jgi:hypothetical protein
MGAVLAFPAIGLNPRGQREAVLGPDTLRIRMQSGSDWLSRRFV